MIILTTSDKARLQRLAQDEMTIAALKKLFISSFLKEHGCDEVGLVQTLAASRLAFIYAQEAFDDLDRMKEKEKEPIKEENPY